MNRPQPPSINQTIELKIDRLSVGGRGVGRYQGFVVFVENTAPDELIRCRILIVKKSFAEATLLEVLNPSPFRISPPCPVALVCGGCQWQQVQYHEQLRQKEEITSSSLRKASFDLGAALKPCVASPKQFRYRNRIQVHVKGQQLGFFAKRSHEIVDIQDCPITDERIVAQFSEVRKKYGLDGNLHRIQIQLTQDNEVWVSETESSLNAFSQVNNEQNTNLVQAVLDQSKKLAPKTLTTIYDLYSGSGNFAFPLATHFPGAKVTGIEFSKASVQEAQTKIQLTNVKNLSFISGKVEDYLSGFSQLPSSLVVLDPPRSGCEPKAVQELLRLRPEVILYVSCDPNTLSRDLKALASTYSLVEVEPFDMFPQTDHVEVLASLILRNL